MRNQTELGEDVSAELSWRDVKAVQMIPLAWLDIWQDLGALPGSGLAICMCIACIEQEFSVYISHEHVREVIMTGKGHQGSQPIQTTTTFYIFQSLLTTEQYVMIVCGCIVPV